MKDKQNITIRIADQAPIPLQINREDEVIVRAAEQNVNKLWQAWMQRYEDMSSSRVLAMVAFQFAKSFEVMNRTAENAQKVLQQFEDNLDAVLLDMEEVSEEADSEQK